MFSSFISFAPTLYVLFAKSLNVNLEVSVVLVDELIISEDAVVELPLSFLQETKENIITSANKQDIFLDKILICT